MYSTRAARTIGATPQQIFRALVSAESIEKWRVPAGMTSQVHEFEPREGGSFRVSLSYDLPSRSGKSFAHTDTYHGTFKRLVANRLVVEAMEFETGDSALAGLMTMTTTITPVGSGAVVEMVHAGVPDAVAPTDNQTGMEMALERLAALVESEP